MVLCYCKLDEFSIKTMEQAKEVLAQMFGDEEAANEFLNSFTKKLEDAEQEHYLLQRQLEQKEAMERSYLEEIDMLKSEVDAQRQRLTDAQQEAENTVASNKKQTWSSQQQIDSLRLQQQQEADEVKRLQQQLTDLQQQLTAQQSQLNETCGEEVAELFSQLTTLQEEKCGLADELVLSQQKLQKAELRQQQLQGQTEDLLEQAEQSNQENRVYKESLRTAREEVQELTCQLQALKAEAHNTRGNSLFAELDDRRVKAEKAAISLKVKYEALVKQHSLTCKHLRHLKCEISSIMARGSSGSGNADRDHIARLENQLSQALNMNSELSRKHVVALREQRDADNLLHGSVSEALKAIFKPPDNSSGQSRLVELLNGQLEKKNQKLEQLERDLEAAHLSVMAETDKVVAVERQLYKSQRAHEVSATSATSVQLQHAALQMRYEPDLIKEQRLPKFKVLRESILDQEDITTSTGGKNKTDVATYVTEEENHHNARKSKKSQNLNGECPPTVTNSQDNPDCKVQ